MSKKLLLATIASVLTINAYAVSSTVTSQDYVDAKDALKQDLIEATDQDFPAGSVVETTDEDGSVTQRGICDADADGDGYCNDNFLVTWDLLQSATDLPETTVTYKTCYEWTKNAAHTDANCILWNLSDRTIHACTCSCRDVYGEGYATCYPDGTCNYNSCYVS